MRGQRDAPVGVGLAFVHGLMIMVLEIEFKQDTTVHGAQIAARRG